MKVNYKNTLMGSILAFILGTSCCWLSTLALWLGGATIFTVLSTFVEAYTSIFLGLALLFLVVAIYQFSKHRNDRKKNISTSNK